MVSNDKTVTFDELAPSSDKALTKGEERLEAIASQNLIGEISIPGDKSMSHRALIFGGLAEGTTVIHGLLESEDVLRTADAVRAFGPTVERLGEGHWTVTGARWESPAAPIDCGNSGTGARLLIGAAAGFAFEASFVGDVSLSRRPMGRILEPLRRMGAMADGDFLPVTVRGGQLKRIRHVNASASAQVKSALLLAGLQAEGGVEIIEPAASRDHSENMLRAFGCDVQSSQGRINLDGRCRLTAASVHISGDPSSAAFPLVAALISPGSKVCARSVMINPLRAGLFDTLRAMGARLGVAPRGRTGGEAVADITAAYGPLQGIEVPAERAPSMIDEYPILAIAAAFASGRTILHGLAELRVKECDRLAAIVQGLGACGVRAWVEDDTLLIDGIGGRAQGGACVKAHDDHRIAMSFLIFGLASRDPVAVDSAPSIATSFPGFEQLMRSIGASIV
ncbi:MAG: 3-phosphoshikimate 1-carboxyvinyltransferase [Sphingomonas bacterium]|nr:3-phosphoshikimate 1-carboxyvinyltransferase [Sphingomonas bacterium]